MISYSTHFFFFFASNNFPDSSEGQKGNACFAWCSSSRLTFYELCIKLTWAMFSSAKAKKTDILLMSKSQWHLFQSSLWTNSHERWRNEDVWLIKLVVKKKFCFCSARRRSWATTCKFTRAKKINKQYKWDERTNLWTLTPSCLHVGPQWRLFSDWDLKGTHAQSKCQGAADEEEGHGQNTITRFKAPVESVSTRILRRSNLKATKPPLFHCAPLPQPHKFWRPFVQQGLFVLSWAKYAAEPLCGSCVVSTLCFFVWRSRPMTTKTVYIKELLQQSRTTLFHKI